MKTNVELLDVLDPSPAELEEVHRVCAGLDQPLAAGRLIMVRRAYRAGFYNDATDKPVEPAHS